MKVLKILGIICLVGFVILLIIGAIAPETHVVSGNQLKKSYMAKMVALNLINQDEKVMYFYSDGFPDIENGMYFVTDQNLVLYNKSWVQPKLVAPFSMIKEASLRRDESFFTDSLLSVELTNDEIWEFPVSSENDKDVAFLAFIEEKQAQVSNEMPK